MSSTNRILAYSLAINEALHQMMSADSSVLIIGQGVKSPWYVGNTCQGLIEKFGPERVIDTPVSENAMTGAAVGAALAGLRPVAVHPRQDFMLYAFDPILNQAANWHYMCGGRANVPVVIWGIINRGGEQAAQHSQALHAMFAHVPGLKVVMPATPYDAKGLMIAAIQDDNPVIYIDDRWLYSTEGLVPEGIYTVDLGRGLIKRQGSELTVVAVSYMVSEATKAVEILVSQGIDAELIDIRSVKPLDAEMIIRSVEKTGRLVIADGGWRTCGVAAEIAACVSETAFRSLKAPIRRVTLDDCPAPASRTLERVYYRRADDIVRAARSVLENNV